MLRRTLLLALLSLATPTLAAPKPHVALKTGMGIIVLELDAKRVEKIPVRDRVTRFRGALALAFDHEYSD